MSEMNTLAPKSVLRHRPIGETLAPQSNVPLRARATGTKASTKATTRSWQAESQAGEGASRQARQTNSAWADEHAESEQEALRTSAGRDWVDTRPADRSSSPRGDRTWSDKSAPVQADVAAEEDEREVLPPFLARRRRVTQADDEPLTDAGMGHSRKGSKLPLLAPRPRHFVRSLPHTSTATRSAFPWHGMCMGVVGLLALYTLLFLAALAYIGLSNT